MGLPARDPVMAWLLDPAEPAMRYLASRDLLAPTPSERTLARLRAAVPDAGWAAKILARQKKRTWWETQRTCYWPKMKGTFWQLELLADLGLTRRDERIANAAEHWFRLHSGRDGGFSPWGPGPQSHLCTTGNAVRTLVRLGYERDERVRSAIQWLVDAQLEDGGWDCFTPPRGTLDAWEALSAFAEIPEPHRSREVRTAIERGAEFYLGRRLLHEGARYPRWWQIHYPWHYWYDVLVGLDFMTALGYGRDPRMREALARLRAKRLPDGRWPLDGTNGDMRLEVQGRPSKMVTFLALRALRRAGRS